MEGEEDGGIRLSKRFSDNNKSGEVDYKTKSGTAWSHSYLNQKPWHPLSYPNQRRKWIAEQLHAERERRTEEVAREYAQEQDFFRQTALISKKEKEKVEMMKAVSFMYVKPPGYNAESAKAAEIAEERKRQEQNDSSREPPAEQTSSSMPTESRNHPSVEKKKPRPKDVFGRPLPTEEEFEILKNAPRLETGVAARAKPFGVEVRNVKCLRCGNYGHQSGDRECPLKDAIMPNEVNRLKRDDPLTAILAHADPTEPLKWELKQQPGMSPPRGGFDPDDPNQQIVAEDIFDEYGGFLGADSMPDLLTNFSASKLKKKKSSKKSKQKRHSAADGREPRIHGESSSSSDYDERQSKKKGKKHKKKKHHSGSSYSDESDIDKRHRKRRKHRRTYSSEDSDVDLDYRSKKRNEKPKKHRYLSYSEDDTRHHRHVNSRKGSSYPSSGDEDRRYRSQTSLRKHSHSYSSDDSDSSAHHKSKYGRH